MGSTADFEVLVARDLADMCRDLDLAAQLQFRLLHSVGIRKDVHRAKRVLLNLAVSDLGDLIEDVKRGSGRSAMRTARVLIEAAINMHTVCSTVEDADRYLAHLDLGPVLLARGAPGHDLLPRRARKRYLHRLQRDARLVEKRWSASVQHYGRAFARTWHPVNLRDRAYRAGRPSFYEGYRIASLVSHGSAAGAAFGQLQVDPRDRLAFMSGRVPYLAPTAMMLGIDAYLEVLKVLKVDLPEIDVSPAWDSLQVVAEHWPAFAELTDSHMQLLWTELKQAGPSQMTYAAFSRGGRRRWYARTSFDKAMLMHAQEPTLSEDKKAALEATIEAYRSDPAALFSPGGWAVLALPGVAATIDWTRRGIPLLANPALVANDDDSWTIYSDEGSVVWRP